MAARISAMAGVILTAGVAISPPPAVAENFIRDT
jgi:hypothetical protein